MDSFSFSNHGRDNVNMAYSGGGKSGSLAERLAEYMDCPCKLISRGTGINDVNRKYLSVLRYGMEHGSSPVLVPVREQLTDYLCRDMDRGGGVNSVRQARRKMLWELDDAGGQRFIDDSYREKTDYIAYKGVNLSDFESSPSQGVAVNCFSSFVSGGKTTCDVLLAQVPTANPWEIFVWLPVGGLNGAPSDNQLVAVSKRWNELCGAVPAVIGYGIVEYFVPRGKPDHPTALEIAKGHFAVCPERALCMTRSHTVSELADTLTKSCVWYIGWKE